MSDWDIETEWSDGQQEQVEQPRSEATEHEAESGGELKRRNKRRNSAVLELSLQYEYRRAFLETKLLDLMQRFDYKEGHCYNFITGGDIDSLSYLKGILRAQNLKYCLLSTWCMAAEDILQIGQWIKTGRIKKMDFYVGEIFPGTYKIEYRMLQDLIKETGCGRVAVFRNHSKIYAGEGDYFAFGIQTSANVNTNPRTENGCIIVGEEIYEFYKDYFDGIKSFED